MHPFTCSFPIRDIVRRAVIKMALCAAVQSPKIEPVQSTYHELSTSLEDAILADAEARVRRMSNSSPSGGAADSLLGDLSSVAISPDATGSGAGTGGNTLAARAPPPLPPVVDSGQTALELFRDMNIGTDVSRRLALAKYPPEDQETVEAFCQHFKKCQEVLQDKVSDLDIAAALYATDSENGKWQQSAMDLLLPSTT